MLPNNPIAFAGHLFETFEIEQLNVVTGIVNELSRLKLAGHGRHGGSSGP
jgi:hypothetical protein